jgi:hypothetical protein
LYIETPAGAALATSTYVNFHLVVQTKGPETSVIPKFDRVLNSVEELRKHKKKDGSLIDVEVTGCEVLFNESSPTS